MNITSLPSNFYTAQLAGNSPVPATAGRDSDGDNDGSRIRGGGGGQLFQAVRQALSQSGLTLPTPNGVNKANGNANGTVASDPVRAALHSFMHTLFQALQQGSSPQAGNSASGQSASGQSATNQNDSDGDNDGSHPGESESTEGGSNSRAAQFSAGVQQLLQSLSSGNGDSALQSSFQNLVEALGGSNSANAAPTLQSFLQALAQDLGGTTPPATGNLHNSQA